MRILDLFAGCGGMSLGFQNVGYMITAAVDYWQAAIDVYQQNFSHPIYCLDLRDTTPDKYLPKQPIDMIIGGPLVKIFQVQANAMKP